MAQEKNDAIADPYDAEDPDLLDTTFDPDEVSGVVESSRRSVEALADWEHTTDGESLVILANQMGELADQFARLDTLGANEIAGVFADYGTPTEQDFERVETRMDRIFGPGFVAELDDSSCSVVTDQLRLLEQLMSESP